MCYNNAAIPHNNLKSPTLGQSTCPCGCNAVSDRFNGWSCHRGREAWLLSVAHSPCTGPESTTVGLGLSVGTNCLSAFSTFRDEKTPFNTSQRARHCTGLLSVLFITLVVPALALYRHSEPPCLAHRGHFHSRVQTVLLQLDWTCPSCEEHHSCQGCGQWAPCEHCERLR